MKISELIVKLQETLVSEGDLPVYNYTQIPIWTSSFVSCAVGGHFKQEDETTTIELITPSPIWDSEQGEEIDLPRGVILKGNCKQEKSDSW
jgi:hypothetical protein